MLFPQIIKMSLVKLFFTFKYQTVYDPIHRRIKHLSEVRKDEGYEEINKYSDKSF